MKKNFDCIVIGYGPVGALLSIFLSKLGLSVAVIDKNLDVYPLPRAIHFDEEVMRIFQMVNLSKQISNISRIGTKGMHFVDEEDNILMERKGSKSILGSVYSITLDRTSLPREDGGAVNERLAKSSCASTKNFMASSSFSKRASNSNDSSFGITPRV